MRENASLLRKGADMKCSSGWSGLYGVVVNLACGVLVVACSQAPPEPAPEFKGFKAVAAYPMGSDQIESSVQRIAGYTEDVKKLGVEIAGSIGELLSKVDFVLLETNDGRREFAVFRKASRGRGAEVRPGQGRLPPARDHDMFGRPRRRRHTR